MHVESTDTLKGYMYGKTCMVADGGGDKLANIVDRFVKQREV